MKERITQGLDSVHSFSDLFPVVSGVLEYVRQEGITRIGYVSGIISSDGPDKIAENRIRLNRITDLLRSTEQFPIFSAVDIFSDHIYEVCSRDGRKSNSDFINFWRSVLKTKLITDIFMTPRWEESEGATDEHNIAEQLGLNIHYLPIKL